MWAILQNKAYLCNNMDIWSAPSPFHVYMIYHCPQNVLPKIHLRRPFRFFALWLHMFVSFLCSKKLSDFIQILYFVLNKGTNILLETYFKVCAKFDNFLLHNKAYPLSWVALQFTKE